MKHILPKFTMLYLIIVAAVFCFAPACFAAQTLRPLAAGEKVSTRETVIDIWRKTALQGLAARNQALQDLTNNSPRNGLLVSEYKRCIIPYLDKPTFFADWSDIAQDIKAKGMDISIYKEAYGALAIYFFLRDIDEAGYRIISKQIRNQNPTNRSPATSYRELNTALGQHLFEKGYIPVNRFFIVLSALSTQPQTYQGVEGMLKLAKWLEDQAQETNLGQLYSAFGGTRAGSVVKILTEKTLPEDFDLNWEKINMPYKIAVQLLKEAVKKEYSGGDGFDRLVKDFIAANPAVDENSIFFLVRPETALYERLTIVMGQPLPSSAGAGVVSKEAISQLEASI